MIEARGLSRAWGGRAAVQDLSFHVGAASVVGLLGPNGAGKTTTLRMLAGALAATAGSARVAGFDVFEQPLEVKRRLGFLPERPPVHPDMLVGEFLRYAAVLRGVAQPASAVRDVLPRAGLQGVEGRLIGNLSKGYRQRVGIACAMVHRPPVLLLDEPASGLDPAERVEIRGVVRELAADGAAVILSTHVLAEAEATCDRVLILHQGRCVGDAQLSALAGSDLVRVVVERPEGLAAALQGVPGVLEVQRLPPQPGMVAFSVRTEGDRRAHLARVAVPHGLVELSSARLLEDTYLRLTGAPR